MSNAPATQKKWALYVYMCGDVPEPGMHTAAQNNLRQMLRAGSSDDLWVVAQISEPDRWTYRYSFPPRLPGTGPVTVEPEVIPTENSASPQAILEFVAWASEKYPADQIMLVLWGHGFGLDYFVPYEFDQQYGLDELPALTKNTVFKSESLSEIRAPFERSPFIEKNPIFQHIDDNSSMFGPSRSSGTPGEVLRASPTATQGVVSSQQQMVSAGVDDHARAVLNNYQIGDMLREIVKTLPTEPKDLRGQKLVIVGFDACAMAMAEVYSELWGTGSPLGIASEAGLPYLSWPYDTFLKRWNAAPDPNAVDVAAMLQTSFEEFYAGHPKQYVTLSTCNVDKTGRLLNALKPLVGKLIELTSDEHARQAIFSARDYSPEYDEQGFIDLGCFVSNLEVTLPDPVLLKLCKDVLEAIGEFVVDKTYSPKESNPQAKKKISQSTGVSVWFPQWIQYADAYAIEKDYGETYLTVGYRGTMFARATGWDELLAYLRDWAWGYEDTSSRRARRLRLTPMQQAAENF